VILLDTNLSELMKAVTTDSVMRWAGSQPATSLYTTSITQAEILHGILLLPAVHFLRPLSQVTLQLVVLRQKS
jgi:predicted nucleic acid-binding protein